jgi:hypothetical protein
MKLARQLIREFWLPLSIAIAWTIANIASSTSETWSLTKVVNITAPTFFFVSWLTAQYFRVQKQEHVSSSLSSIESCVADVMGRLEKQTDNLTSLTNAKLVQTFDECIDALRDAKEELADRSRRLKSSPDLDAGDFGLNRGNPFYPARRFLDMLISYAAYAANAEQKELLKERFTRCSYHVEELAGHMGTYIGRLNHHSVSWKTERSLALVNNISSGIERFEIDLLAYSRYASEPYKGGQDLRNILKNHVAQLRKAAA